MIESWQGPTLSQPVLERIRELSSLWQKHTLWSETGRERWNLLLNMPLPPLPMVGVRFSIDNQAWRGAWLQVNGVPSLWTQARTHREKLSPWFLIPLEPIVQDLKVNYWSAWLDHVAMAANRLSPAQTRKACPQADLAGRLSGPSWALLSGRAQALQMIKNDDFLGN